VDLENGNIKVVQALCDTKEGLKFLPPKTKKSIRDISIPKTLVKILKKHKIKQLENKLRYGEYYQNTNLVCCYENGQAFNPKRFSHKFNDLLTKNELPVVRFHDLRHSHASLLVKLGIQPKIISDRLGHSNISITMDLYSHVYKDTNKEVANMFDTLIRTSTSGRQMGDKFINSRK
jgi:integrase